MSPLRRRMIDDMQIRNLTPNTQRAYVGQIVGLACHFGKSPELLGPDEIRTYLIHQRSASSPARSTASAWSSGSNRAKAARTAMSCYRSSFSIP